MNNYVPADNLLSGRVIVVTGAGEGIGRCAAMEFASLGAEVVLLGRTQRKLEAVYDEIVDSGYKEAIIHPMNLLTAKGSDYIDFAQRLKENMGRLDGILHNAAELDILTPIQYYDEELWESTMRVNTTAPYLLTQACLPLLLESSDSSVVFITDDCARRPKGYWGAYAVSKAATEHLALTLAIELQKTNVRVNVINPGPCRTGMRVRTHPGASIMSVPPPKAIMPVYDYLMGPDSKEVRGQIMDAREWLDAEHDDRKRVALEHN